MFYCVWNIFLQHQLLNSNEFYIRQTLKLARKGLGKTATNPLVGAVLAKVIRGKETVIGKGYHHGYGKRHAEVEAVLDAKRQGHSDLSDAVLYVNLEPCCHFGKTPPCTDLIIGEKISHVVFGTLDPFKKVSGQGLAKLRASGIHVEYKILENECRALNKSFFKYVNTGLPWVTLKMAQSLDGQIATISGDSKWISSEASRKYVHRWRREYDAVLVGAQTVIRDNPSLNVRLVRGRDPKRIIVDGRLRIPMHAKVVCDPCRLQTIIVTAKNSNRKKIQALRLRGIKVLEFPAAKFQIRLKSVLKKLASAENIASILVEGGAAMFGEFLKDRLADDVCVFIAPKMIGQGTAAIAQPLTRTVGGAVTMENYLVKKIGSDLLIQAEIRK
jgi:diaminohydroxyphosphoribosylaminopyrimidine deaminase/5-amino-6-(5-phosphoribosylamino)uracil reductase